MRIRLLVWVGCVAGGCVAGVSCVPPLDLAPTSLPNGAEGAFYSQTLAANGEGTIRWEVRSGSLPPGLALGSQTGILSGTPTTPGLFTFTIGAVDSSAFARSGELAYSLLIIERLRMDATLPSARVGVAYNAGPAVTGGVQPYLFEAALPGGFAIDPATGTISGTTQNQQRLTIEIRVTDSGNPQQSLTKRATLDVKPPAVSIETAALPDGIVGQAYDVQLQAANGRPPYKWAITSETSLPPGTPSANNLRLDPDTGWISGKPGTADSYPFSVTVTDSDSPTTSATKAFTIVIKAPQ